METVLVVEDSKVFSSLITKKIESQLGFAVVNVSTLAEAQSIIEDAQEDFFVALLDLNLPDAPRGEIVDYVLGKNIPSIVFTSDISDDTRDFIWSKNVIDYVVKEGFHNIDYILWLIGRIYKNRDIKVMVVDDSKMSRKTISRLLNIHNYRVYEAENGMEAVGLLKEHDDIKMIITDYNMPHMDGFQLTKEVRSKFKKDEVAIIGISSHGNVLSAKFIKTGANDYINKPFSSEEFYCRISQNIEIIEKIRAIRDASNKDYLTGLYNRRYFFDVGRKLYANQNRDNLHLTVAMLDIDDFKKINDSYGHEAGDKVLQEVSGYLLDRFRLSDIVARFGGEEFCVLATNMDREKAVDVFEDVRKNIKDFEFEYSGTKISVTVSIGLCREPHASLDDMVIQADKMLYKAKNQGRNSVICAEEV